MWKQLIGTVTLIVFNQLILNLFGIDAVALGDEGSLRVGSRS